jgi:hypothetical protein
MSYDRREKPNDKPRFNRLKGEEAMKYDEAQDDRDVQPEGRKYKGVKNTNASGTHAEGQHDKRDDDATMHPSSADE